MAAKVYLWDVMARREKVKWKVWMDSAQEEGEWWATVSSIRNGVMNGTEECKCAWGEPVKGDIKHGMVGGEGKCARGRREDCALGVVVHGHGHCCERVLVDCCLRCRVEEVREYLHGNIEDVVRHWPTVRMRECECKKEGEREKKEDNEGEAT